MTDWYAEVTEGVPMADVAQGGPDRLQYLAGPGYESPQGKSVGFGTMTQMGIVDDPRVKARILAEGIGVDPSRIFEQGGQYFYADDDGKLVAIEQSALKGFAADLAANSPALTLGAIGAAEGAMKGAPAGPWGAGIGAVIGGAIGGASGEGYRKAAAGLLYDEPQTVGGNLASMGQVGAIEGASALGGHLLGRALERRLVDDIGRMNPEDVARRQTQFRQAGIDYTIPEVTGLSSMRGLQKAVSKLPRSADQMQDFYVNRAGQIDDAMDRLATGISPVDDSLEAGAMAQGALRQRAADIASARKAAAGPKYQAAYNQPGQVDVSSVVDTISRQLPKLPEGSQIRAAMDRASRMIQQNTVEGAPPLRNLEELHMVKMELDDMIQRSVRAGSGMKTRELMQVKQELLKAMDDFSPDYKLARSIWSEASEDLDFLDSALLRQIAKLDDTNVHTMAQRVFNARNHPRTVAQLRDEIRKADPEAWNALMRGYIDDVWNFAGKDLASDPDQLRRAPRFRQLIFGDKRRREIIAAAMDPDQLKGFTDMMDVFDSMGRVSIGGSDTAWNQQIIKEFEQAYGSAPMISPGAVLQRIKDFVSQARIGKHSERIAQLMTDPDGIAKMRELRRLNPNDQRAIFGMASALGISLAPDPVMPDQTQSGTLGPQGSLPLEIPQWLTRP